MKEKTTKTDVGVIVARFQVHNLTEAHIDLVETVRNKHNKVIIFLGLSPVIGTRINPLDFESRKQMVLEKFPDVTVLYIKDVPDDAAWSKRLDEQIGDLLNPGQTVTLYGSRDSFINHYNGHYTVTEFEASAVVSGTELRKEISSKVKASADFRAGVIWAVYNQFPKVHATIDVIIYDERGRLLLVRKNNEKLFRFVGGFAQPDTDNFEDDAKREVLEEVGVEVADYEYVGNAKIDDWRYRQQIDKIKTIVFKAKYIYGAISIKDTAEIAEARWFYCADLKEGDFVPEHRPIFERYAHYVLQIEGDKQRFTENK
jgi:bifunctional NMN adenylyltransferase/nudix hydrolase